MLLIDRKEGTSTILMTAQGQMIKITVIAQTDYGVKLGFEAPLDINIMREEVYNREYRK